MFGFIDWINDFLSIYNWLTNVIGSWSLDVMFVVGIVMIFSNRWFDKVDFLLKRVYRCSIPLVIAGEIGFFVIYTILEFLAKTIHIGGPIWLSNFVLFFPLYAIALIFMGLLISIAWAGVEYRAKKTETQALINNRLENIKYRL